MKRAGLWLVAGAIAAAATLCVGAVAPVPSQGSAEIEQLKKEVAALRQRVAALEEQAKESLTSGVRKAPPHWSGGEVNGVPYYICPLGARRQSTNAARKQTARDETPAPPQAVDNIVKP